MFLFRGDCFLQQPLFFFVILKTKQVFLSFNSMKRVNPTLEVNTLNFIPRDFSPVSSEIRLTITQDGSNASEVLDLSYSLSSNGNYMVVDCEWTILEEDSVYFLEVLDGPSGALMYRDRLYSTSTDGYRRTINSGEFVVNTADENEQYIILED